MGDPFAHWSGSAARTEYEDSPHGPASFARPSAKSIYNQRKDYGQTLLKPQSDFQHHVEHLLTLRLERELRGAEDCVGRLRELEAQGKVWGQDVLLGVRGHELLLSDVESREDLDSFPLSSIQDCLATPDVGSYDSVLAVSVQERGRGGSSVLLFHCHHIGAGTLKSSLEKLVRQRKEEQRQYGNVPETPPDPPYVPVSYRAAEPWAEHSGPQSLPPIQHKPPSEYGADQNIWMGPNGEVMSDPERDVLVLNHVLGDMELLVGRLRGSAGSTKTPKKKKKKKKKDLPSKAEYVDFFQKAKYALNLLAYNWQHIRTPSGPELLDLIFQTLTSVLEQCPHPHLAEEVETPLLLPEALQLLEGTLLPEQHRTWQSLGMAWHRSRAQYPNADQVPRYVPTFSDGWLPPPMLTADYQPVLDGNPPGYRDAPGQLPPPHPPTAVRALYEFQGRNPQELSVRMGDTLQVLDQQKKWWLVRSRGGQQGYVPSNILEPVGHEDGSQGSPPTLHVGSSPAEVTAWLKDKGFSPLTVRCLGVLGGQQLLQMRAAELRAVCPEEWRRVLFKLSSARSALGMDPTD